MEEYKESLLEAQPEDHIRHICSFLSFNDILRLEQVSTRFCNVTKYIISICIVEKSLGKEQLDKLCNIIKESKLQELILHSSGIRKLELTYLAPCLPKSLKLLNLSCNGIGNEGLAYLGPYLPPSLQILMLTFINIDNVGAELFGPYLPKSLQQLDLGHNNITDNGIPYLECYLLPSLQIFSLYANDINDRQGILRKLAKEKNVELII
jgi:hypothetical protein